MTTRHRADVLMVLLTLGFLLMLLCDRNAYQYISAEIAPDYTKIPTPESGTAFAIDVTKPVRFSFPLDIGKDTFSPNGDGRLCLRARQGANEVVTEGKGNALYFFSVPDTAQYWLYFSVRWIWDSEGDILCNNSWFARIDDGNPIVIGNNDSQRVWHWEAIQPVQLKQGAHWLLMELREDGVLMDKVVVSPRQMKLTELDSVSNFGFSTFENLRPAHCPQLPVAPVEFSAFLPESLVIGKGHNNEVGLNISLPAKNGFYGKVAFICQSATGLTVEGATKLAIPKDQNHHIERFKLVFPQNCQMRDHFVNLKVTSDDDEPVYSTDFTFTKPFEWAFLGPLKLSMGRRDINVDTIGTPRTQYDDRPLNAAKLVTAEQAGIKSDMFINQIGRDWAIIRDGSCCDWTGAVDLKLVYGPTNNAYCYATTWISAETHLDHRSFMFSADDGAWLWMNGKKIVELPVSLPKEANRLWTSAKLNRGENPIVIKLVQYARYWGFSLSVVNWHWQGRRGDTITGVPFKQ